MILGEIMESGDSNIHEFAFFQYSMDDFSFLHRIERLKVIARFFFWATTTLKRPLYK